jgi:hypothetical protein
MSTSQRATEHEEATIRAFIVREKQDRFLSFIANPKKRKKLTGELAHFRWFDRRFATEVSWKVDPNLDLWARRTQGIGSISRLLRSKGAAQTCWVISESSDVDGREMDLASVLEDVIGSGVGTILSCIPGRLAYFEGEDESLLLAR